MKEKLSRRDFLKLGLLSLSSLAFNPIFTDSDFYTGDMARVSLLYSPRLRDSFSVPIRKAPDDTSEIICSRFRDELLNIYYEVTSDKGPGYNPVWYRVWQGYVHSGDVQKVNIRLNPVLSTLSEKGQMMEVTVPYTQAMRYKKPTGWYEVYRLYETSVHWAVAIDEGPDGQPWYRLKDELLEVDYHVPAIHMRAILPEEITPLSPDVPAEEKRIEVSLGQQTLTAYEGDQVVLHTKISSGVANYLGAKTETPKGNFRVYSKMPSKHMGDGRLTNDLKAYELPGVPWTSFFEDSGVAFHGTYWHQNFGMTRSHGCINMKTEEAKWIFRWVTPISNIDVWEKTGNGTKVTVS